MIGNRFNLQYFVTDVDGTLTDGRIYTGPTGEAMKAFSVKDGYALSIMLREVGIEPIVITGRKSSIVDERCRELGVSIVVQNVREKLEKLIELVGDEQLESCAYFGDDIVDLPCMLAIRAAGGKVGCPADAAPPVKGSVDYICSAKGGDGAAREFIEWLLMGERSPQASAERIRFGIESIRELIADGAEDGIYRFGDWVTVEIKHVAARGGHNIDVESHRKNADIQWVIEGTEAIDISSDSFLVQKSAYDERADVTLWHPRSEMTRVVLSEGSYVVLHPGEAHRPCISVIGEDSVVRVAIAKILLR